MDVFGGQATLPGVPFRPSKARIACLADNCLGAREASPNLLALEKTELPSPTEKYVQYASAYPPRTRFLGLSSPSHRRKRGSAPTRAHWGQ
jgi:hypothetical protein